MLLSGDAGRVLVSVATAGRKTHLEAHDSQLRQTVHIRTQDFVLPDLQGLSAPGVTQSKMGKLINVAARQRNKNFLHIYFRTRRKSKVGYKSRDLIVRDRHRLIQGRVRLEFLLF